MLKRHLRVLTVLGPLCCTISGPTVLGAPAFTSTITLTSAASPTLIGQPLTLTATVTAGATGQVTFYDSGLILGISPIANGQAKFTTKLLPPGMRSLRAHYGGDATYLPSDSVALVQGVVSLPANSIQQVPRALNLSFAFAGALTADFNGDGREDLAFLDQVNVSVLPGSGDGGFQAPLVTSGIIQNASVNDNAVGDFNGDGIPDLGVVVYTFAGNNHALFILLGKGDGTFRAGGSLPVGFTGPDKVYLAVADFNGDGKADVVLTANSTTGFEVLLGNGDGTFQPPASYNSGGGHVTAADLDGDGKPDLVFAGSMLVVLMGNGDGTFRGPVTDLNVSYTTAVLVGDFNGDGRPDLIGGGPSPVVFLGSGDGTFQKPISVNTGQNSAYFAGIGDFNGDGNADVVGFWGAAIGVWYGNGDGTFQAPTIITIDSPGPLAVGEFNGDGRDDFALINGFPNPNNSTTVIGFLDTAVPDLTVAETRAGSFVPGTSGETFAITVGNLQFAATSGTVTVSDTLPAGLTASAIGGTGWTCTLATVTCTRSDSLAAGGTYPTIVVTVAVSDNVPSSIINTVTVTGGGILAANKRVTDTIITRTTTTVLTVAPGASTLSQPVTLIATVGASVPLAPTGQVTFYDNALVLGSSPLLSAQASLTTKLLATGKHVLRARYVPDANTLLPPSLSLPVTQMVTGVQANGFLPAVTFASAAPANSIVLADFNGDGKADVAITGGSLLSVLLGNGDGTFRSPVNSVAASAGITTSSLAVADFNGDGKPDLVLAFQDPNSGGGSGIDVLLGKGDGTFQAPSPYTIGSTVTSVVVADFNGDGVADIALGGKDSGLYVLLGKGGGTFQLPVKATALGFYALVAADFNGDGIPDIVYVGFNGAGSVQLGNGDGTFQSRLDFAGPSCCSPISLVAADFNGDGKLDVAISEASMVVLFGNGDGTFQAAKNVDPSYFAWNASLAAGDVNGDGYPDIIMTGPGNAITKLLSNGDGTFQAPIIVTTGGAATAAAIGDLNGDGRADVAVANGTSGSTGILLGGQFAPPTRIDLTVWRPSDGNWYVNPSNRPFFTVQWGLAGDVPVAANFDRDGQLDFAVWRPSLGNWYLNLSSFPGVPQIYQWGLPGDIPVAGDYDGDGRADYAVWRPSNGTWYVLSSQFISPLPGKQWGLPNDIPIVADFDGDGRIDYAVWRPSEGNWYITLSATHTTTTRQWGLPGDIPVAADFDGDGKADYAVWRPAEGNWYITLSSTGATMVKQWGLPGDIPVPRDYDGDGKADFAVWRPSNGTWYIIPSANPTAAVIVPWGLPNDIPIYKPAGN